MFPVFFFAGEQYMKTPVNFSMKAQGVARALSRAAIWNVDHL